MADNLEKIEVNKTSQWILCRGNESKPIALFVHGGPASPLMYFSRAFDDVFLKDFLVVHWDQRLSGKSYDAKGDIKNFSLGQVAKDGIVVAEYLKNKFKKQKILLVGHSWGSMVGSHMAMFNPELFSTYLSVGSLADIKEGDRLKYEFLRSKVRDAKDKSDLEKMGPPPWAEFSQLVINSRLMMKFKGSLFGLTESQLSGAVDGNKEYNAEEMKNIDVVMEKVWKHIFPTFINYRAIESVPKLSLPVIFVHGKYDMATPAGLAKEFFDKLNAPKKNWVDFKKSAHFPMYEEPNKFLEVMIEAAK